METQKNSAGEPKAPAGRKIATALLVLVVLIGLALAARFLVGSLDIVELLKSLHGG